MNEYDEEDEDEDDHTHTHTQSNSHDPRSQNQHMPVHPQRQPAEEMMKNQEEDDEEYSHQHTDSHEHTSDSGADAEAAKQQESSKGLALNSSKKNQMSMKNLATLPAGAKQSTSPKVEGSKDKLKVEEKLKGKLNPTSEEGEDENKYTSQNNEDEKYTTEQNYTDEYSSVQNKTGMNFNKPPADVNIEQK